MRNEHGQFAEGNTGRPKGAKNKYTNQLRGFINHFLEEKQDEVLQAFAELSPRDKVKIYIDLLQYSLPKMKQIEYTGMFDDLSDNDLDKLIEYIENHKQ